MPHILRSKWTDLSGQLHVIAALNLGKDLPFPFRQIVMGVAGPIWPLWEKTVLILSECEPRNFVFC